MDAETKVGAIGGSLVVIGVMALALFFSSFGTVPTGKVGLRTRFGAVTGDVIQPGFYLKTPFISGVTQMDVQIQREDADAEGASRNLQNVNSKISVNYRLNPGSAIKVYSSIGKDYADQFIRPAIQEVVKSVTAKYDAEELITKRQDVSDTMKAELTAKMAPLGIEIVTINILNFDFSQGFNQSIEAKVTAEQDALAAQNKLKQVEFEAQQAVAEAKGKAEALTIEGQAIQANPTVVQLRALEKWNGILPTTMIPGATVPFIGVK